MVIQIEIRNAAAPKSGYGQWRFNSSLANDEPYAATLKAHWHYLLTTRESFRTTGLFWNAAKQQFRSLTTAYAAQRQRCFRAEETQLSRALKRSQEGQWTRESYARQEKIRNQLAAHVDRRVEALRSDLA
ncbi:uncharacterized protein VTP21DRAFT_11749 [Calcarisporiella thermophila]|uniref:uncharacterized protein n=1 Tax=Calcarisporiella thermophila TaxID=911321 RepID=UPI0037424590